MDARNSRITMENHSPRTYWRTVRFAGWRGETVTFDGETWYPWEGYVTINFKSVPVFGMSKSKVRPPHYWSNERSN